MALLIPVGLRHSQSMIVSESLTVKSASFAYPGFEDMPHVFGTAYMVGFIEWACVEALKPYISSDQRTVGIHVNLSHCAATPVGMKVTADVELIAVEGRRLTFKVICRDEVDIISEGDHQRYLIDLDRFVKGVEVKSVASRG